MPLEKNVDIEQSIPDKWKSSICHIVNNLIHRVLRRESKDGYFIDYTDGDLNYFSEIIDEFEVELGPLCDKSWATSICRWDGEYWQTVIDLCDSKAELVDLALFLQIEDNNQSKVIKIVDMYVP